MNTRQQKIVLEKIEDRIKQLYNLLEDETDTKKESKDADPAMQRLVKQKQTQEVKALQQQYERLEEGEFGLCKTCGEEIRYERLLALPAASYCVRCAN